MKRFCWEYRDSGFSIFDRSWSNSRPIAWAYEEHVAEAIVNALNREIDHEAATTATVAHAAG